MKRTLTLFLSIILLSSTFMYGCQPNKELKTFIYEESDNGSIFHASKSEYEKFDEHEYKENISQNQITIDVLGTKHTGVYANTTKLPRSDLRVHVYKLQGTEFGKVFIDSKTGKIVEYISVPFTENPVTESDYNNFIKRILNGKHDLSKYKYSCSTHYYSESSKGFSSQEVYGFRILKENESLGTRSFYYTRSKNGFRLPDHIAAEFYSYDKTFSLEVYEYEYDLKDYSPLINRMDDVKKSVDNHLRENLKDGYVIESISHGKKNIFIQDGAPYVMVTSTVKYKSNNSDMTITMVIQTITG